jgi:hypothetical protein
MQQSYIPTAQVFGNVLAISRVRDGYGRVNSRRSGALTGCFPPFYLSSRSLAPPNFPAVVTDNSLEPGLTSFSSLMVEALLRQVSPIGSRHPWLV